MRGSYYSSFALAASSSASGEPSNGQLTSTTVTVKLSADIILRSGLLFPVVPGIACSLNFVPKLRGTARTILSRMALCLSRTSPQVIVSVVQHLCEGFQHPSTQMTLGGGDLLVTSGLDCSRGQQIESSLVYNSILGES